jgi:hypothetical protein
MSRGIHGHASSTPAKFRIVFVSGRCGGEPLKVWRRFRGVVMSGEKAGADRRSRKMLQENKRARQLHRASTLLAHPEIPRLTLTGSGTADRPSACISSYVHQRQPSVMTISRFHIMREPSKPFPWLNGGTCYRAGSPICALHAAVMWGSNRFINCLRASSQCFLLQPTHHGFRYSPSKCPRLEQPQGAP